MKEDRSFYWINSVWRGKYIGALDLVAQSGVPDAIDLEVTLERKENFWASPDVSSGSSK